MKLSRMFIICLVFALATAPAFAQQQQQAKKKRLLAVGMSVGWQHDSVSDALGTLYKLGLQTGLWETYVRTDTQLITKQKLPANGKNLDYFDAVFFMTTGELPLNDEQKAALLSFVRDEGKGFLGAHNATDTCYNWPEYGDMIGGYFDGHPWMTFKAPIKVIDSDFPAVAHFPAEFELVDEIYQTKQFDPSKARVLMTLDTSKVDMTRRGVKHESVPITWVKNYGKGRVFYCGLGHPPEVWQREDVQKLWIEAVKWSMGLIPGDATPRVAAK